MGERVLDYLSPKERPPRKWEPGSWVALFVVAMILALAVASFLKPFFAGRNRGMRFTTQPAQHSEQ